MKASWIGPETKPYRTTAGIPMSHGEMLTRHVAAVNATRHNGDIDIEMYEGHECPGTMVLHGDLVAGEDGVMVPHWHGSALHHEIVCDECMEVWTVESDYCKLRKQGVAGIEIEDEKVDIPW